MRPSEAVQCWSFSCESIEPKMEYLPYLTASLLVLGGGTAALGYGSALSSVLRIKPNVGDRGILGLLSFGFLGCLIHFVSPLTAFVQLIVLGVGLVFAASAIRWKLRNSKPLWMAGTAIFLCAVSSRQATVGGDVGLYYLQTMRWIREAQIVPGLANLHGRLGFDSLLFLIAGVADRDQIGWVSNFLIVVFVLLSLFTRLQSLVAEATGSRICFWLLALSILILLDYHWYGVLVADSFVAVLIIYWTCLAIRLSSSSDPVTDMALLVLTSVLALAVKISAVPLLLPTVALAWQNRTRVAFVLPRVVLVSSLLLSSWVLRNYILSGCAIYPLSRTCISTLPWAASNDQVRDESLAIRSWARQPDTLDFNQVLAGRAWLLPWVKRSVRNHHIQLFLLSVLVATFAALLRHEDSRPSVGIVTVVVGTAGGLIFWFASAPDLRFGMGFLTSATLLGGSVGLGTLFGRYRFAGYVPVLLVALMLSLSVRILSRRESAYFYSIPKPLTIQLREPGGHRVFVPESSDRCWDHELPCTPYFNPAALGKVKWPSKWPAPLPTWTPDNPIGVVKGIDGSILPR